LTILIKEKGDNKMIVYIHSHEMDDSNETFGRHAGVSDVRHITVPEGTTVFGIVELVREQVRHAGSIWTLIFNGHGDSNGTGEFLIGMWIDASNIGGFARMGNLMNRAGHGVEIHACQAGRSRAILGGMANALGVRVTGGLQDQIGLYYLAGTRSLNRITGDSQGRFEGPTVTVYPGGRTVTDEPVTIEPGIRYILPAP
jgi:hypothetical protein